MSEQKQDLMKDILESKKVDIWQVIDTYFRDNPNYKNQTI